MTEVKGCLKKSYLLDVSYGHIRRSPGVDVFEGGSVSIRTAAEGD